MYVPADKTTNIYKLPHATYSKLLNDNITTNYKKASPGVKQEIDREAKKIASNLKVADRAEAFAKG